MWSFFIFDLFVFEVVEIFELFWIWLVFVGIDFFIGVIEDRDLTGLRFFSLVDREFVLFVVFVFWDFVFLVFICFLMIFFVLLGICWVCFVFFCDMVLVVDKVILCEIGFLLGLCVIDFEIVFGVVVFFINGLEIILDFDRFFLLEIKLFVEWIFDIVVLFFNFLDIGFDILLVVFEDNKEVWDFLLNILVWVIWGFGVKIVWIVLFFC